MQNLHTFVPLPEHIIERRRKIIIGESDLTTSGNSGVNEDTKDKSKKNHIPTAAELHALKAATIFAKDGYVTRPNSGAAGVSVWVPRGWRCEETQPSWSTTVLYFTPVMTQTESPHSKKKTKNATPQFFSISPEAAADPIACLRLTIQDLHSEVGEQTATEYCADVVSNIYREQTRFLTSKYKVSGPKIVFDQPLGQQRFDNESDAATTTTDDEDFNKYQKMMAKLGGGNSALKGDSGDSAAATASSSSTSNHPNHNRKNNFAVPAIGGFTNILSYQTTTVIERNSQQPKRVPVCSTSVITVKGRLMFSLELQSSPANHSIEHSFTQHQHSTNDGKGSTGGAEYASASWVQCFLQMAQVMRFDGDSEAQGTEPTSPTHTNNLKICHGVRTLENIQEVPHCRTVLQVRQSVTGSTNLIETLTPPIWTPNILEMKSSGKSGDLKIIPALSFDTNSETFPARIELYMIKSSVAKEENDAAVSQKAVTGDVIAALGLQRSYTSPAITYGSSSPPNPSEEKVTLITCQTMASQPTLPNSGELSSQFNAANPSLSSRRVAILICPSKPKPHGMSSWVSIVAVEVPLRRNLTKTPAADLACFIRSVRLIRDSHTESIFEVTQKELFSSATPTCSLQRRIVNPAMGYSLLVGDGCQCLATSFKPSEVRVALRPTVPYVPRFEGDSTLVLRSRSSFETVVECPSTEDEGLLTISGTYAPKNRGTTDGGSSAEKTSQTADDICANTDMTSALLANVRSLAADLAGVADSEEIVVAEHLSMVGAQKKGILVAAISHGAAQGLGKFFPYADNSEQIVLKTSTTHSQKAKEWPSLQAHLKSVADPTNGAFVTLQSVYDVSTNRGIILQVVSPNFALFRKHRPLIMDGMLASFEFFE